MEGGHEHAPRSERAFALALIAAAAIGSGVLLVQGWGRWNDVLVDFGRELYVPWRIVEGDVLYRDLAYLNGPLAPYANAALFRLFGVGLATLTVANAVLAGAMAVLIALVLRRAGGVLSAGVGLASFLLLFAAGHFTGLGNYNFLAPYSHDLTHGVALAFAVLACLLGARDAASRARLAAAGVLLGLVLLTKPEAFVAAVAGVATFLAIAPSRGERSRGASLAIVAGASLVPPIAAFLALSLAMPFGEALRGVLGAWPALVAGDVAQLDFYRRAMGIDDAGGNALRALASFATLVSLLAPAAALDLRLRSRRARTAAAALVCAALALLSSRFDESTWLSAGRLLIVTTPLALGACIASALRAREHDLRRRWAIRAAFACFALALLAKIALAASLAHYGFALALPATLVLVMAGVDWIPALLRRRGGSGWIFRAASLALVGCTLIAHWRITQASFARKTVEVAGGADAFFATPVRGRAVNEALRVVEARLPADATLLVLPEGVMIDYIARRRSPTRYYQFMPPELLLHGEEQILAALRATPPHAVLLVHRDTSEYGLPLFGIDYGREIMSWVRASYPRSQLVAGDPPLKPGSSFGIELLERAP